MAFKPFFFMKKATHIILSFSLLVLSITQACNNNKCSDGYVSDGDDCKCPEGKFEGHRRCRTLDANEYYAIAENCACRDTAFFLMFEPYVSSFSGDTLIEFHQSYGHKDENTLNYQRISLRYFKTEKGFIMKPNSQDSGCGTTFSTYGGYYDGGDTIVLYRFNNLPDFDLTVVDTCVWKLHK